MKIEMCDNTFTVTMFGGAILAIALVIGFAVYEYNATEQTALKAGYNEVQMDGAQTTIWQKP